MGRNVLVDNLRWCHNPQFEYHLVKSKIFFSKENIFTVFPECEEMVEEVTSKGESCAVYLICTFQETDGELITEEMEVPASVRQVDRISQLISMSSNSVTWKDRSRLIFFSFLHEVESALRKEFAGRSDPPRFFCDASDPATGIPVTSRRGPSTLCDSDIVEHFFSYHFHTVCGAGGGCRMMEHPVFGFSVYPSSLVIAISESEEEILKKVVVSLSTKAEGGEEA